MTTTIRFIPTMPARGGRLVIALAAAGALAFPAHAFADAAPPATSFAWNVQLAPDTWEGGTSPDLPDAIVTAEAGETLTQDQIANLVAALTAEAAAQGASTVAIAPAATSAPAPAVPVAPASDDGQ